MLVVLLHSAWLIGPEWKSTLKHANIGVDIFFIISGFIIYFVTEKKSEANARTFLIKRAFRIYPVFILALFVAIGYTDTNLYSSDFLRSLFLFHLDYTASAPTFKLNTAAAAWTLTYEIYFYLIFMLSFMISHRYRGILSCTALLALPIILQLLFNGSFSPKANASAHITSNSIVFAPIAVLSCTMIWEFAVGIFLAFLWKKTNPSILNSSGALVYSASGVLLFIFLYLTFGDVYIMQGVTGYLFPAFCIFVSLLIIGNKTKIVVKPLNFLGDISYSMYMTHAALNYILVAHIPYWWRDIPKPYNLAFYLVLMLIVAAIVHYVIEKPAISLCRIYLRSKPKVENQQMAYTQ